MTLQSVNVLRKLKEETVLNKFKGALFPGLKPEFKTPFIYEVNSSRVPKLYPISFHLDISVGNISALVFEVG